METHLTRRSFRENRGRIIGGQFSQRGFHDVNIIGLLMELGGSDWDRAGRTYLQRRRKE
jgi:hypothetical protein